MIDSSTNSDIDIPVRILQLLSIELEATLNELGRDGWELVSATDTLYTLKRLVN